MKTSTFRLLNIIAINLLLLALYLNFFHKDNNTAPEIPVKATSTEKRTASTPNDDQSIKANSSGQRSVVLN